MAVITRREWAGRGAKRLAIIPAPQAVPPPVTPTTWYDPSDLSTLTLSGDQVTQINDKTAGGKNASGGTGMYLARQRTGPLRPVLSLTGGGLWTTSISASDISSSAFFVVCQVNLGASRAIASSSSNGGIDFYPFTDGTLKIDKKGIVNMGQTTAAITAGTPCVIGYSLSSSAVTQYINTTSDTDAHAQTLTAALTFNMLAWTGWVGEMLFYDTTLNGTDSLAVVNYLIAKWGIA